MKFDLDREMFASLEEFYVDLIIGNDDYRNPLIHRIVPPEMNNMLQVCEDSYKSGDISENLVDAPFK